MKQTQTHAWSLAGEGSIVLAGETVVTRESGEVARSGVLSGASSLVSCTWPWAAPGRSREW